MAEVPNQDTCGRSNPAIPDDIKPACAERQAMEDAELEINFLVP